MAKKRHLLIIALIIVLVAATIWLILAQRKVSLQKNEISNLEDKIANLEKSLSKLQEEKGELEKKVTGLSEINRRLYVLNLSLPNEHTSSSKTYFRNYGHQLTGNGIASVVYKPASCDYFILENASGYIVAEWMGGNDPDKGDKVTGDFNSFGTKDFYNQTEDSDCTLWIDDYMLSWEDAMEKIKDQCN